MPAKIPDPNVIQPIANVEALTFAKPDVKNQNIIVGDFTYFADKDFERHVTHHYDFIGDKLIIGANSVVASDVAPYTIVAGNPAKLIRKRFDDELTALLLQFKWWDKSIEEINNLIPVLTSNDLKKVKAELKARLV